MGKMSEKKNHEELRLKDIEFEKTTPAPLPSYFYMEMVPNIDTRSYSNALDSDYKIIHTPITEMFPIDVLAEMRSLDDTKTESWLRQGTQIDSLYYQEKSDRNELLMRDEQKHTIEDVLDYQKYLQGTFEKVSDPVNDIIEEYPLLLCDDDYVIMTSDVENTGTFRLEKGETSLVDRCIIDDQLNGSSKVYDSTKLHVEDKICIEIKNEKAFYSAIRYVYRLSGGEN
ncbi:uncharacterized protein VICG_00377 [Vittaforma corneae ATCC 50505]|uniref:Uncharacterized protein n=1 Tax=Vittaforma corneae (strain ATCC 50505) TaxID=993615 RepID=L2GQ70_VITCO|nr:uncharacterized protein VICG_00377 [Vittaforma corneae ATCC 50505]ELA42625.1 hypothetical protein VICG_00377 [Vittaforma corneae ATCC 50505]